MLIPGLINLVAQVDLIHRRGISMLGHLDPYMVGFVRLLRAYFPKTLKPAEMQERLDGLPLGPRLRDGGGLPFRGTGPP